MPIPPFGSDQPDHSCCELPTNTQFGSLNGDHALVDDPILLHRAGRISAEVALARLVLMGASSEEVIARLRADTQASGLLALAEARRDNLARMARMVAGSGVDYATTHLPPAEAIERIARSFGRAMQESPELAVAAYSLDDPATLQAATTEIVTWLRSRDWVEAEDDVLDFGCGYGRVVDALAPHVRSVIGLDASDEMVAEARRRYPGRRFERTRGIDLEGFADGSLDLVLAVDAWPYLIHAGAADAMTGECARVLRARGRLVILNLSYCRTDAEDAADACRWAATHGLHLLVSGQRPFTLWDGTAYVLAR